MQIDVFMNERVKYFNKNFRWIIVGILVFSALLSSLFLTLLRIATRPTVYVSIFTLLAIVFLASCFWGYLLATKTTWPHGIVFTTMLCMILEISICLGTMETKLITVACEIIREATKTLLFFPSLVFFPLLFCALVFMATGFFVFVVLCMESVDQILPSWLCPLFYIWNIYGFFFINAFLFALFRVILSGTYGTWYWTKNKHEVPNFTPIRFTRITFK
ncbi:choline transporter-like protein 1 [Trichogramma pretiosum]|uniref:choline transporter-like protein 1 n=1 Tax=Trichogramma pretiosum TaxID=7493 RepID=UPI000C71B2C0|nr:choline transporter-like protein 1 [Trichogramma pretiosum]